MDTQPVFPKGHLIDFENWERKDNYNFFRDFENPSISITSEVECARAKDRFAVVTKNNGNFIFSTRDNKKTLRAVRNYVDPNNMVRSLSFFQVISRGLKSLFKRK